MISIFLLKYGFCKKLLRYKWTFDQLNTFLLTFCPDQCWSGKKVRTKVFNWSEVHLYRSNFLQNPYFSYLFSFPRHLQYILTEFKQERYQKSSQKSRDFDAHCEFLCKFLYFLLLISFLFPFYLQYILTEFKLKRRQKSN